MKVIFVFPFISLFGKEIPNCKINKKAKGTVIRKEGIGG